MAESRNDKYERLFVKFSTEAGLVGAERALAVAASRYCYYREQGVTDRRLVVAELDMFDASAKRNNILNQASLAASRWANSNEEPA